MTAVRSVAIVGAGFAGYTAGILLAEAGVHVQLFDSQPGLSALGSGITIQGNACRIFAKLGIWPAVEAQSYGYDVLGLRAPDENATVLAVMPDAKAGGPEFPATVGMYRPDLAQILFDRAESVGVTTNWNCTVQGLSQDADGVELVWHDTVAEQRGRFDLVIGADGIHSTVRSLIGIDIRPKRTGMGIWRAFVHRPAEVTHTELVYGGSCYIAGYSPTSEDSMYAYLVEDGQDRSGLSEAEGVEVMRELAATYHGPWDEVRENLSTASRVNYTWFTTHLVDGAWNRGRVALVGDAAHSCPPTMAQGAAMAVEDAAVLAELLIAADTVDDTLWQAYTARRLERARVVVDASVQLGTWLLEHDANADVPGLMHRVTETVTVPA